MKSFKHSFLAMLISLMLSFSILPTVVLAASYSHTPVTGISVSVSTNNGKSTMDSAGAITITTTGGTFLSKTSTATITNNTGDTATITFKYTPSGTYSEFKVAGTKYTSEGTYSSELAAGATVEVSIKSSAGNSSQVVLSNFTAKVKVASSNVTVTYNSLGVVTADETVVSSGNSVTVDDSGTTFVATPNSGATFLGWVDTSTQKILSTDATYFMESTGDVAMEAVFVNSSSAPHFAVSNTYLYDNLVDALTKADSSGIIALLNSGTLSAGNYTIPYGVTLLIPFDDANTVITTNMNDHVEDSWGSTPDDAAFPAKTLYRQLTMSSGTKLIVANGGMLNVGSRASTQMVGQVGPYGAIKMESNSNITVQDGGALYSWGYVNGSGTVTVESNGSVYESLSIMDYPNDAGRCLNVYGGKGSGITEAVGNIDGGQAYPLRSITLRCIEVPMTFQSGAKGFGFYHIYGKYAGEIGGFANFIGTDSDSIFQLGEGATFVKAYKNGRQSMKMNGTISLNPLTINVKFVTDIPLDSSKTSGFPFPSSWDMEILGGTTTINENIIMCEGATFKVHSGATVNGGSKTVFVMDAVSDPGTRSVKDIYGTTYTVVNKDAVIDVNGTFVTSGDFQFSITTDENGNVISSTPSVISSEGTGKIEISGSNSKTSTFLKTGTDVASMINLTPASLQNGDGSLVSTASRVSFVYDKSEDVWRCTTHTGIESDHTCDVCGIITSCIDENQKDHKCDICKEPYLFKIYATNIAVAESLDMYFYIKTDDLVNEIVADKTVGQGYYAIITRAYTGTNEEKKKEIKIPSEDWSVEPHGDVQCVRFCYDNISAKEMTDIISVEIYKSDGIAVSEVYEESVALYAERTLDYYKDESDQTMRTALVNLLKYGEACQDYFDYNETNLATSLLSEEEKNEATQSDPECTNKLKRSDKNPDYFVAASVSAKNRMMYTFYFKNVTDQMTATITYTNFAGDSKESTVLGKDFYKYGNWYGVDVTGLSIVDGRQLLTCVVRDSAGNVVTGGTDSVEGYIARAQGLNKPIFGMLMRFVDSAIEYSKVQADTNA